MQTLLSGRAAYLQLLFDFCIIDLLHGDFIAKILKIYVNTMKALIKISNFMLIRCINNDVRRELDLSNVKRDTQVPGK